MNKEISRRDFLKLAVLGSAGILVGGCGNPPEIQPKEIPPKPPLKVSTETKIPPSPTKRIETKPTPTEIKEKEQGILWTQGLLIPPETSSGQLPEAFFTSQDKLFLAAPDGYPTAFNLAKGEKLWQWEDRGTVYGAEPETTYVVRPDKRLYALDARSGQTKWKVVFNLNDSEQIEWPLWIGKETIHLPFSGRLILGYAFFATIDKRTGNLVWLSKEPEEHPKIIGMTDQTLVVQEGSGYLNWRGFDMATGKEKWATSTALPYETGQVSETILFYQIPAKNWVAGINPPNPSLVAFDIDSGKQLWQSTQTNISSILTINKSRVYASYGGLTVIDRQTGKELWNWKNFGSNHFVDETEGITILTDGNLGYTYKIEAQTGNMLWQNDDLRLNRLVGISKNTLIGVYQPSFLFGLNPTTGERKWRLELSQVTHKVIIFHDKLIYGKGRALAILNPETGTPISTILLPDQPTRLVPQKDFLLAQTGTPGRLGTVSAVRI